MSGHVRVTNEMFCFSVQDLNSVSSTLVNATKTEISNSIFQSLRGNESSRSRLTDVSKSVRQLTLSVIGRSRVAASPLLRQQPQHQFLPIPAGVVRGLPVPQLEQLPGTDAGKQNVRGACEVFREDQPQELDDSLRFLPTF